LPVSCSRFVGSECGSGTRVRTAQNIPDGDAYDLAATWFFKPHVAMQVSVARASQGDLDTDFVALRFIGRL
jgi:hypothetical protein